MLISHGLTVHIDSEAIDISREAEGCIEAVFLAICELLFNVRKNAGGGTP